LFSKRPSKSPEDGFGRSVAPTSWEGGSAAWRSYSPQNDLLPPQQQQQQQQQWYQQQQQQQMCQVPQTRQQARQQLINSRKREDSRNNTRPPWGSNFGLISNQRCRSQERVTPLRGSNGAGGARGRFVSPRDDRRVAEAQRSISPRRSTSAVALSLDGTSSRMNLLKREDSGPMPLVSRLQAEIEELRSENAKLIEKLSRSKTLLATSQRQTQDALADRDRERLKAESLHRSSQHLMRQLKHETAKVKVLQRRQISGLLGVEQNSTNGAFATADSMALPVGDEDEEKVLATIVPAHERGPPGASKHGLSMPPVEDPAAVAAAAAAFAKAPEGTSSAETARLGVNGGDFEDEEDDDEEDFEDNRTAGNSTNNANNSNKAIAGSAGKSNQQSGQGPELSSQQYQAREGLAGDATTTTAAQGGSDEDLEPSWEFVVQGRYDEEEAPCDFARKQVRCYPPHARALSYSRGIAFVCMQGRRLDSSIPNQDDFVVARHRVGQRGTISLYGVFDGHGPAGQRCAAFVRGALPECIFGQRTLLVQPEETLRQAFVQTQSSLLQQPFDTDYSGTTAVLALVLSLPSTSFGAAQSGKEETGGCSSSCEDWLFVAHVGDSRAVLLSKKRSLEEQPQQPTTSQSSTDHQQQQQQQHRGTSLSSTTCSSGPAAAPAAAPTTAVTVTSLLREHRPDDQEEAARIANSGGEVRRMHERASALRVFAPGQDRPALALTRTFGAVASADCGVVADPEVASYRLRSGIDSMLLLGTDGLFEFCSDHDAGNLLHLGVAGVEDLCQKSREQWARSSYNETVDDITAIAAVLPTDLTQA